MFHFKRRTTLHFEIVAIIALLSVRQLCVFSPKSDCYDPHFAWHQMIEAYIKTSGIPYTFLHPNCFMQNFTGMYGMAKDGAVTS